MSEIHTIELSVRWWSDSQAYAHRTLRLPVDRVALVLIDCDGIFDPASYDYHTKVNVVTPALQAARRIGMPIVYFHNAPGGEGGPSNINRELHGLREAKERLGLSGWKPFHPRYDDRIAPHDQDAQFQKAHRNGFRDTFADQYLRTWGIDTLLMAGFSLKSCLYHTCAGAHEHNYRVIVLRDGVCAAGTKEYPDTLDPNNPEGGWMRFVMLRLIETNIGYTTLSAELISATDRTL
jgi:nicotinamidase-related amidase